ncbi:MAG: hypothetical protein NCW75_02110 [Phycisphaera sp.]|nr:MAG: hypothetical protein NCW75_02110 [Phycisphaera sp.]
MGTLLRSEPQARARGSWTGCTADLDCDGSLTIFDQQAFGNAFDAMDPVADWDGDGSFTIFDYQEFGNTYDLGCP